MSRAPARHSSRRAGNTPVSGEISYRRPAGPNADGLPTIRNRVPWRDMERKLAERLAARAANGELTGELEEVRVPRPQPPTEAPRAKRVSSGNSGVRPSIFDADGNDVSYAVYSLAQLDARRQERPRLPPPPPEPSPWEQLLAKKWPRTWGTKTVLTAAAIAVAALGILFVLAIALADVTDDMKPIRTPVAESEAPKSVEPAAPVASSAPPPPKVEEVAATPTPPTLELDDIAPAPTPALRASAPKRAPVRKKAR